MERRKLTLDDLHLRVNAPKGKFVEQDITCDSKYMLMNIRDIGQAICDAHSFLPNDHPIYLLMDNAGGHGRTEVKKQYEEILLEEYNVIINWQVPNSPELNLLDLGMWMALQSYVELIHQGKVMQSNELANLVKLDF